MRGRRWVHRRMTYMGGFRMMQIPTPPGQFPGSMSGRAFNIDSPPTEIEGAAFSGRGGCQRLAGSASHHITDLSIGFDTKEVLLEIP